MNETRYSDTNSFVRKLMALYAEAAGISKPEPVAESENRHTVLVLSDSSKIEITGHINFEIAEDRLQDSMEEQVYLAIDWPTFIDVPR